MINGKNGIFSSSIYKGVLNPLELPESATVCFNY